MTVACKFSAAAGGCECSAVHSAVRPGVQTRVLSYIRQHFLHCPMFPTVVREACELLTIVSLEWLSQAQDDIVN